MGERKDYGLLINQDTKLHRIWFKEMVKLLGVNVVYKYPLGGINYTPNGEFDKQKFSDGEIIGCIFEEYKDQKTAKKMGWNSELTDGASVIHLPYDLHHLQIGCLVEIPSAYDHTQKRLFRITKLTGKMIYPSSIACEVVPEYIDTMSDAETELFTGSNFNLLNEG